jgi:hypothetical protein
MKSTKNNVNMTLTLTFSKVFGGFKYFAGHIWKHAINGPKEKKRTRK